MKSRRALRLLVVFLSALCAGCGALAQQAPGMLAIRNATLAETAAGSTLELGLDCRLSGPMQDALDHGIPITLQLDLRAGHWPRRLASTRRRVELRYFPLSRRYQLHGAEADDARSFSTPAYLLAALGSLRVSVPATFSTLPPATPLRLSVHIDPAALPGALRLPALFEPAWRLAAKDVAWTVAAR